MDIAPQPFDVCGPLPEPGVTVLEASAGTGKTFTIAALATRLVAAGVRLEEILAVTFTRMATGELRDRVRDRLVSAEDGLGRFLDAGEEPRAGDEVLRLLAEGSAGAVQERRDRLGQALAVFDAATITTTHGFCHLVLAGLGVSGQVAAGATLLEDPRDLVEEVVDDLFVRGVLRWEVLPFGRREALAIGLEAVANPDTPLEPGPGDDPPGLRRRLAEGVRVQVARRLLDANLLTYDDLLVRLEKTLADPERGETACARLRDRYRVVLIDEFQDTDPVQWEVVRRAFGTRATTLVLIGDPKQAIYAFRGADVYAYLDAARLAHRRYTLGENWRSDESLLAAYDVLLSPSNLGHPEIPYRKVSAAPTHHRPGLVEAPVAAALRARVLHSDDHDIQLTAKQRLIPKPTAVEWVAGDLAADVVRLLESGAQLVDRSLEGSERARRGVGPGDVAVLVRTNYQAAVVHQALRASGVPAVVAGTDSVFSTPAALDWLRLLEALEQPAARARAVAVALTPFLGMTATEVAGASEETWEQVHARLHNWADLMRRQGVATLFRAVAANEDLPGRVLMGHNGERELTDLGHVAELLHAEASASQLGPSVLRAWLARRIDEAGTDAAEADARSRRLDSDAEAVQVLTVHRAKGLEFPIVYCPYLWDAGWEGRKGRPVVFHDASDWNRRKLDVGGTEGVLYDRHYRAHHEEERGEDLRHLYVALTRAKHQAVIYWARVMHCQHSPLGRLLMSRDADGNVEPNGRYVPKDRDVEAKFADLAQRAPGSIAVERCSGPTADRLRPAVGTDGAVDLRVASFERSLDLRWRRTSYSGITAAAHDDQVGSEPEQPGTTDEPGVEVGTDLADGAGAGGAPRGSASRGYEDEGLRGVPSLWGTIPGGVEVGTFVHSVLEHVDFSAQDLNGELLAAIGAEQSRHSVEMGAAEELATGLEAAISTPLGPLAGGARLREVGRADRLDEVGFELPLAGGDQPAGEVSTADVARLFAEQVGDDGPLAGYATRLADPLLATELRGYLTGSLDLVFRLRGDDGAQRFFVADYKTNRLGAEGEPLSIWHYRPAVLDTEMQRAHYPLQAIFYQVALHRYLRWRLPGYDPEQHLAGVLYLFVRGMAGPNTPAVDGQPCGVFAWRPPTGLVAGLSDLFDAGPAVAVAS